MPGFPLPTDCAPGVLPRWKNAVFAWARDGALVVAATPTAINDSDVDEYRLQVCRFDDADPPAAGDVQELEASGCSYLSLDARPDGTLDLFYYVDRQHIKWRASRDGGATWESATTIYSTASAFEAKDHGMGPGSTANESTPLRHCFAPNLGLFLMWNDVSSLKCAVATPDGAGGLTLSTPVTITAMGGFRVFRTLQPLRQGVLAIHGAGEWYEGLKADGTHVSTRSNVTALLGIPMAGRFATMRNLLLTVIRPASSFGNRVKFRQDYLNDTVTGLNSAGPAPPNIDIYLPDTSGISFDQPAVSLTVDLRFAPDGRPWLLYPRGDDGSLDFTHLEKLGTGSGGTWVPTPPTPPHVILP
jgi:hypothetical protein